jgi:hypothetical protein
MAGFFSCHCLFAEMVNARLSLAQQLGRRSPPRLFLKIDIGELATRQSVQPGRGGRQRSFTKTRLLRAEWPSGLAGSAPATQFGLMLAI